MHSRFYNELILEMTVEPRTPLLIKSGAEGELQIDPTLPDMNFVRTRRGEEWEVFLPGSSLRGVVRSHVERLIRSVEPEVGPGKGACDPNARGEGALGKRCFARDDAAKVPSDKAYRQSCRACRIFGNTVLASRVRVTDFHVPEGERVSLEVRHGVAIDRVTGAVAQGPFEMEVVTDGKFRGSLTIRNFTVGQLGLVAAALLDIGDGLVPIGFGKSKGLGRVGIGFDRLTYRTLQKQQGRIRGVAALAGDTLANYGLPDPKKDDSPWPFEDSAQRGFWVSQSDDSEEIRAALEELVPLWTQEKVG